MTTSALPRSVSTALQDLKTALMEIYGSRLAEVDLYGSYARGQAHQDSDIDVLVVLHGPVRTGEEINRMNPAVSRICLDNDLLISALPVSAESFHHRHSPFLLSVRRDLVPL